MAWHIAARRSSAASAASTTPRSASRPSASTSAATASAPAGTDADAVMADWNFYLAYNMFRIAAHPAGHRQARRGRHGIERARRASRLPARGRWPRWAGASPSKAEARRLVPVTHERPPWISNTRRARRNCRRSCCASWTSTSIRPRSATRTRSRPTPQAGKRWTPLQTIEELKPKARAQGLWNLFLPPTAGGKGSGKRPRSASRTATTRRWPRSWAACRGRREVFNCSAPDTGNMETIERYGSDEHKARWLEPLLDGKIRCAFAMTEPAVASSDATNIESRIERRGRRVRHQRPQVVDLSGAGDPRCKVFIFMGKTDPDAPRHSQQSMVLVPADTHGHHASCGRSTCSATTTRRTATWRCCSRTCACRSTTSCSAKAAASRSRRAASGPGASTTACA